MPIPTQDQRKAQFDAVSQALAVCLTDRLASDLAAAKAGSEADQINILRNQHIQAIQAYANGTGTGAAVDAARSAYFAVANVMGADMSAAQSAYVLFSTDWTALNAAVQGLLSDPGAVERV